MEFQDNNKAQSVPTSTITVEVTESAQMQVEAGQNGQEVVTHP